MQFVLIVLLCIGAAVAYGIAHDQITARICVEYFTIGHPPVFNTDDPTLLGFGWGVIATWWVGFLLGVPLALIARVGSRPKRSAASLVRPIAVLMGISAGLALLAGLMGWFLASLGAVFLVGQLKVAVPADRHVAFLTDLWAHNASYLAGFVGGIALLFHVWSWRRKAALNMTQEKEKAG